MSDHAPTSAVVELEKIGTNLELSLKRHLLTNATVKSAISQLAEEVDLAHEDYRFHRLLA